MNAMMAGMFPVMVSGMMGRDMRAMDPHELIYWGVMSLAIGVRRYSGVVLAAVATFILGAVFLTLELREFHTMIALGATPQRSAFLSAFFTLVGCHGIHITVGLIWLILMLVQLAMWGFRPVVERRFLCFALFWHALDIIWVMIFTAVYLMGVVR